MTRYCWLMRYKIEFTDAIVKELKKRLSSESRSKIYRRLLWLDLKRQGYQHKEIGSILQVSQGQITNWSRLFAEKGFEGLCSLNYEDRRRSKLAAYLDQIKAHVQESSISTLSSLQAWLEDEFGIFVEQSWLSRWIKKNSIVLIKRPA